MSRSPSLPASTAECSTSKSPTPPPPTTTKASKKAPKAPVQLIADLPIARDEAVKTFREIADNNYQYKSLGRSREILESMTCDCVDSEDDACGPYSDCINRLTQVECLEGDCRCRSYCQNQRFQKKQYANIDIVLTEKKGYGLRAESDIPRDTFIYEYVGDVVNPASFKKRMREYAEEGIRHFYFMMLQKDEFIDATKSGGIGRFANHSCNPNCYVAKWTVGDRVRMGIFAKRNIQAYEELTFNYNVDRYGHQAQECFCGEPMCVGYIGGKTQTDISTMDDLYLDALGITDEADLMELKGTKKKKGKKIDDPDFMPDLKPVTEKEVPKVVQAIRQTTSRKVLSKLLTRIKMTEDQAALRQIMRLRGYSLMTNVLEDYATDIELITLALECMKTWPLLNRNKVQDSKVHVPVEACLSLEDENIKSLAKALIDHWETLPVYNRIPKRVIDKTDFELRKKASAHIISTTPAVSNLIYQPPPEAPRKRHRLLDGETSERKPPPTPKTTLLVSPAEHRAWLRAQEMRSEEQRKQKESIKAIIALAAEDAAAKEAEAAAAAAAAEAEAKAQAEAAAEKAARRKERALKKEKTSLSAEEKEANKEKRLLKLVGAIVVKCMSKHAKSFDKETFKSYAKQLTQTIADSEKKSSSYKEGRLDTLPPNKEEKIKKFAKDSIIKTIHRMKKTSKLQSSSTSTTLGTPSTSMPTPSSHDGEPPITPVFHHVDDDMEMEVDYGSDDDYGDMDMAETKPPQPSRMPASQWSSWNDPIDIDEDSPSVPVIAAAADPRRRPPVNS
ncbi:SET domain-containing protein [Agrocybe pediades]|nr:SET domain-containing protein [Agrocybe pediades]